MYPILPCLALLIGLALASPPTACQVPANADALAAEVLRALNAERAAQGLSALRVAAKLDRAAQAHACDNAARRSVSHVSSDGGTLKTRLRKAGYAFRVAAENTGRGFDSAARAIDYWMGSPGHRANILLGRARDVGIGIALSDAPDSTLHWVLNFGRPR